MEKVPDNQEQFNAELERSIIEEGQRLRKENYDEWLGFLNNFWAEVLPEDNRLFTSPRKGFKSLGWWDKKLKDVLPEDRVRSGDYSELRLNQTGEEFYKTIDRVIVEVDPTGEIQKSIDKLCNVTNVQERQEAQDELEEKLLPVFARLVAMGYSRIELIR